MMPAPAGRKPGGEDNLSAEDASKLIHYDFFEEEEAKPAEGEEVEEETSEEEASEEAPEAETEEAPEEEEPPQAAEGAEEAEEAPKPKAKKPRRDPNAFADELLTAIQSRVVPTPVPASGPPAAPVEEAPPAYDLRARPELAEALSSEDVEVRLKAINSIVNGVAQVVHANLRKEYREHVGSAVADYVNRHSSVREVQREVATDFYGKYPSLNTPARRAVVLEVAKSVMAKRGAQGWDAQVRDEIASAAAKELNLNLGGSRRPASPAQAAGRKKLEGAEAARNGATPGRRPPKQMAGGSRPGGTGKKPARNAVVDDINDTLFGFDR